MATIDSLRRVIRRDSRSWYVLAKDANLAYPIVNRLASGQRDGMTVATLEKLAAALDHEVVLRPKRRRKKGG